MCRSCRGPCPLLCLAFWAAATLAFPRSLAFTEFPAPRGAFAHAVPSAWDSAPRPRSRSSSPSPSSSSFRAQPEDPFLRATSTAPKSAQAPSLRAPWHQALLSSTFRSLTPHTPADLSEGDHLPRWTEPVSASTLVVQPGCFQLDVP